MPVGVGERISYTIQGEGLKDELIEILDNDYRNWNKKQIEYGTEQYVGFKVY